MTGGERLIEIQGKKAHVSISRQEGALGKRRKGGDEDLNMDSYFS